ncbi:hypothetical protein EV363DRAFT_1100370, partial [Boletus edulis]
LNRQEAVRWFNSYLTWRNNGHTAGPSVDEHSDDSETDDPTPPADQGPPPSPYRIARRPRFPRQTAQSPVQHHGAFAFVDALQTFLSDLPSRGHPAFQPTLRDRFDCFSNIRIPLQPLELSENETARIRSHPEHANGPRKPPTLVRYGTALVKADEEGRGRGGFHAEVRVIFRLPPRLGVYPHPLVYLHLFKPVRALDSSLKMFYFGRSTCNLMPNAVVVPITDIVQPCHLVP